MLNHVMIFFFWHRSSWGCEEEAEATTRATIGGEPEAGKCCRNRVWSAVTCVWRSTAVSASRAGLTWQRRARMNSTWCRRWSASRSASTCSCSTITIKSICTIFRTRLPQRRQQLWWRRPWPQWPSRRPRMLLPASLPLPCPVPLVCHFLGFFSITSFYYFLPL